MWTDLVPLITVLFILLAAMVGMFVRRITRDRCLKDFEDYYITLEKTDGKTVSGTLLVENTGLEILHPSVVATPCPAGTLYKGSTLMYKSEYGGIGAMVRYLDQLSESNQERRQRQLDRIYHPGMIRRALRRIKNIFKTIRDSMLEIFNLLISQVKKVGPAGTVITAQDKYVTQMKNELVGTLGSSYEPLLENYIGHRIVLEFMRGDHTHFLGGILREYTSEFIEIMDVDYCPVDATSPRKADLVVLRSRGVVRHLGE